MKYKKIKILVHGEFYIHVHLFPRERDMYEWISTRYKTEHNFQAMCYYTHRSKKLANILFCKRYFDASTVAHEAFHIVRHCHEKFAIGEETQAILLEKIYNLVKKKLNLKRI